MNTLPASDAVLVADIRQRINTCRLGAFLTKQWSLHCGDNVNAPRQRLLQDKEFQ